MDYLDFLFNVIDQPKSWPLSRWTDISSLKKAEPNLKKATWRGEGDFLWEIRNRQCNISLGPTIAAHTWTANYCTTSDSKTHCLSQHSPRYFRLTSGLIQLLNTARSITSTFHLFPNSKGITLSRMNFCQLSRSLMLPLDSQLLKSRKWYRLLLVVPELRILTADSLDPDSQLQHVL